jgi:tellurite resistance protein TerC
MSESPEIPLVEWLIFAGVVVVSLTADLFGHRRGRSLGRKSAIVWSVVWISLALAFGGWIWLTLGREEAQDYLTAWLIEKSLSIDNLFVFLVIFERLRIAPTDQHRVLFWGILGALVTRAIFIASGAALLSAWHSSVYVLGAFLIYTGLKTLREHASGEQGEGKVMSFVRRHVPFSAGPHGGRFFVVENGRRVATTLMAALVVIEITDVLFAIDSIPAVFSVTSEPFIVYSSNVFAILGMRALYLVLADLLADLRYLRYALSGILVFAGLKMLIGQFVHVPHYVSLLVIAGMLAGAIIPSVVVRRRSRPPHDRPREPGGGGERPGGPGSAFPTEPAGRAAGSA